MDSTELILIGLLDAKLQLMIKQYNQNDFYKSCALTHLAEMVKLAHQIRSLEAKD